MTATCRQDEGFAVALGFFFEVMALSVAVEVRTL